ncbi:MAG: hypothetical protein RIG62_03515 [Cyclobacteriaceae bacterium]
MDTRIRDILRKNRPPFDHKSMDQMYHEHCQIVWKTYYRQLALAYCMKDDRRARFFLRKWRIAGPKMRALESLFDESLPKQPYPLNVVEKWQLLLELIDDLLMMRRCMKPLDIWMAIYGVESQKAYAAKEVPIPDSLAPYGYLTPKPAPPKSEAEARP